MWVQGKGERRRRSRKGVVKSEVKRLRTDWSKSKEYKNLKKDLLDDLEARGLVGSQYTDKVEEYMDLWCLRNMLKEDIAERGVYVAYQNGANQKGTTDNKSVEKIVRVSSQLLSIWTALGFRDLANGAKVPAGGEDDEL